MEKVNTICKISDSEQAEGQNTWLGRDLSLESQPRDDISRQGIRTSLERENKQTNKSQTHFEEQWKKKKLTKQLEAVSKSPLGNLHKLQSHSVLWGLCTNLLSYLSPSRIFLNWVPIRQAMRGPTLPPFTKGSASAPIQMSIFFGVPYSCMNFFARLWFFNTWASDFKPWGFESLQNCLQEM